LLYGCDGNAFVRNAVSGGSLGLNLADAGVFRGSDENRVERNTFLRNAWGVRVSGHSTNNVIARNEASESFENGIQVDGFGSTGTLIESNVANRNEVDGIEVQDPTTTVTSNRANRNGSYGIEAVAGTIDGGGNRAFGNGNPLQCLNVACK
jgi:parallel beta-helix repeat protein